MEEYTNSLIDESSPYLLQHAHNPVDWVAWSQEAFDRADKEGKLVLVSVGYSACHWCHVMEHQSFEDSEVAALMNKFFVNIKVDREERPDVDQVYMNAVQLMTQQGGWPLNCFTLPDGRPIYGGTYFPKEQWLNLLKSLWHTYMNEKERVFEYAAQLTDGIKSSELISSVKNEKKFEEAHIVELVQRWSKSFDITYGGNNRAPKFPMPTNLDFLMEYGLRKGDSSVLDHVEKTLDAMAMGGIYDQIGGGFSRYSVDMIWKVPHFEKMLYDNGQLLSTYAKGYKIFKKPLYRRVMNGVMSWMEKEMTASDGSFYSALDADSEGVEGKFYVWKIDELEEALGKDFNWVRQFYSVGQLGHWEDGNYILLRRMNDAEVREKMGWSENELEEEILRINQCLFDFRSHRIRPGLDNKTITSWNAMAIRGLADTYVATQDDQALHMTLKAAKWIVESQLGADGSLVRIKNKTKEIPGFLEDYALTIDAFIALYSITADEEWLSRAKSCTEHSLTHFLNSDSSMFYFTHSETELIARKMEINDNVIPSSNSIMAKNLFRLSKFFRNEKYAKLSTEMLGNVYDGMEQFGSGYSNWASLLGYHVFGHHEIIINGKDSLEQLVKIQQGTARDCVFAIVTETSNLSIVENHAYSSNTDFQVCSDEACLVPTGNIDEVLEVIG